MRARKRRITRRRLTRKRRQRGGSEKHTVVIIEPQKSKQAALEFVIRNVLLLSAEWSILIFYGTDNQAALEAFVGTLKAGERARITLKPLGVSNLTEKDYNRLMMSRDILDQIPTEMFLVVQVDSLICREGIGIVAEFMKYDYVGAPWKVGEVGNGGFSLRRKSKMLEVLEKCSELIEQNNEDGFFSGGCAAVKVNKPSVVEAEKFAVETIYTGKQPFGIHKAWAHIKEKDSELESKCSDYRALREINMGHK